MKIANPIYDGAFKFLMKDLNVARRFISILLKYMDDKKYTSTIPDEIAIHLRTDKEENIILNRLEQALEDKDTLFKLNEQLRFQENLRKERQEIAKQAAKEAEYNKAIEIAAKMKKRNMPIEYIIEDTGLNKEIIEKL